MEVIIMTEISYLESAHLYEHHRIAEWPEKCCVLTPQERDTVLREVKEGKKTPLVEMVSLPFPAFVAVYFENIPQSRSYFEDPSFAYKIYFLNPSELRYFTEKMRTPKRRSSEIITEYALPSRVSSKSQLPIILETKLENIPKIRSANNASRMREAKYAYLTQYIDRSEAARLHIPIAETFVRDDVDGYGLEEKMSMLNPVARAMMALYIGLYGLPRLSKIEICKKLGLRFDSDGIFRMNDVLDRVIDNFFPFFFKTAGEFKNYLGYDENRQIKGNMIEYSSQLVRDLDIELETRFIMTHLSIETKKVLAQYTANERRIYVAAKYMFKTPESLARNIVVSKYLAKKIIESSSEEPEKVLSLINRNSMGK